MNTDDERPMCGKGLHYLDLPDATYTLPDGRTRCRACRSARKRRERERAKRAAEAAAAEVAMQLALEQGRSRARAAARRPPAWMSREKAARHRLAVRVRESRGLMPPP